MNLSWNCDTLVTAEEVDLGVSQNSATMTVLDEGLATIFSPRLAAEQRLVRVERQL